MQVIACQLRIAWEDKPANHQRVRRLLDAIEIQPNALIVLPEMFATGFSMNVEAIHEGEASPPHPGERHDPAGETEGDSDRSSERFCAELARERAAHVIAGVVRRDGPAHGRNQAVVFDPRGREIARYTKMHPMTVAGEADHYTAGGEVTTFDIPPFTLAPFICYDLRFPEIFRTAVGRGAHLLPVIANWPAVRQAHWRTLLIARAIENQAYVVGVNRTGPSPELDYIGGSIIIDPRGEVVAEAGEQEMALVADIELEPLREYRGKFPALADRRWA